MLTTTYSRFRRPRSTLAASLAAALALAATAFAADEAGSAEAPLTAAQGPTFGTLALRARAGHGISGRLDASARISVTRCDDDAAAGSLRAAVASAKSGDTIDLGALRCGSITLRAGAIDVAVNDLVIEGPGAGVLSIDAHNSDRVFRHSGAGTLAIQDLTLRNGRFEGAVAYGGCVYSAGSVALIRTTVTLCAAVGIEKASGGGIATRGDLSLEDSGVSSNIAAATVGKAGTLVAAGGGADVHGRLTLRGSTLSGNTALAALGKAYAGAAVIEHMAAERSTIADNRAIASDGGDGDADGGRMATTTSLFLDDMRLGTEYDGDVFVGEAGRRPAVAKAVDSARASKAMLAMGGVIKSADLTALAGTR